MKVLAEHFRLWVLCSEALKLNPESYCASSVSQASSAWRVGGLSKELFHRLVTSTTTPIRILVRILISKSTSSPNS